MIAHPLYSLHQCAIVGFGHPMEVLGTVVGIECLARLGKQCLGVFPYPLGLITDDAQAHLHFRFLRRGYSQRRAAVIMWAWAATLAGVALATRFIPLRAGGEWHLAETLAYLAVGLVALAFSVYIVYLLEIVKLASPRARRRERAEEDERLSA